MKYVAGLLLQLSQYSTEHGRVKQMKQKWKQIQPLYEQLSLVLINCAFIGNRWLKTVKFEWLVSYILMWTLLCLYIWLSGWWVLYECAQTVVIMRRTLGDSRAFDVKVGLHLGSVLFWWCNIGVEQTWCKFWAFFSSLCNKISSVCHSNNKAVIDIRLCPGTVTWLTRPNQMNQIYFDVHWSVL